MAQSQAERNPIDELAEDFAERFRRGERPALSEYIRKYPELADEIREVFPALVMMEQLKPATADLGVAHTEGSLPEQIGDYRLLRELGRGGMGIVYEAEQISLGRHVALKVFPATGMTDRTHLERFRREAKAAARLHHTNIVPVFGVGENAGVHYYAMQFIHGEGLDKVLEDLRRLRPQPGRPAADAGAASIPSSGSVVHSLLAGQFAAPDQGEAAPAVERVSATHHSPLSTHHTSSVKVDPSTVTLSGSKSGGEYYRSMARIGLQVAEGLAYAHKQGILHRDIKPSNLILDLQGTVWITDFGLAKAEGAGELTHTGDVVGTVRYMPPERFEGSSLPQGDIYAVGMTLYELLTLRPAFDDANHARLIQRIGHEDPPRPRKLVPHIPRDLETIVLKAGARDTADRYATAEALAEDLQRFLSDRPIHARRHPALERLWRWCRRNPAVASLIGVIAALLIGVAVGSTFMALSLGTSASSLRTSKKDAEEQLWRAKLSEARATTLSRQPGQRFTSLKRIREALAIADQLGMTDEDRLDLRNATIAALALPDIDLVDKVKEWDGWPAGTTTFDFDTRLERYARADNDGKVSIRRVSDDRELIALPSIGQPATVRFSPSGRHVVVCGGSDQANGPLQLWQFDLPAPRCIHQGTSLPAPFTDFSPDGGQLAYESLTQLTIFDLATGRTRASAALPGTPSDEGIIWNPKGNQVAVGRTVNGKGLVEIRELTTGAVVASLWHDASPKSLAWHPDGRRLAVGEGVKIYLWDVPSRERVAVLEGHKNSGIAVGFNHTGDRLISSDYNGMLRMWDVASGRQLHSILGINGTAAFGPDDRSLACVSTAGGGRKLQILRFAAGREVRTLFSQSSTGSSFSMDWTRTLVSPDGQLVAIRTWNPRADQRTGLAVLDRQTGQPLGRLPVGQLHPLAFELDGSLWTAGLGGDVLRWPQSTDRATGTTRFGPPQPVVNLPGTEARALTADGRILVLGNYDKGALILHRRTDCQSVPRADERLIPTGAQEDVRYGAVSPDGRWVATGSHWCTTGVGAKVWHAATGRLEKQFAVDGPCHVGFSPDGRWFVSQGSSLQLWRTGTWEERSPLLVPGDGWRWAFSADSRLLALGGHGRVRLVRPNTGAEVARLALPEQTNFFPLGFTPDGDELLVQGEDTQAIHVWDLRLIRAQLAELGLDWDDPPLPPRATEKASPPRAVEFVGADLVADAQKLRQYRMALNVLALSANPFDARAHFQLGQMTEDHVEACAHYTASLAFQPNQPLAYENRAVASFSLKRWSQVVADADQVLKDHPDRVKALNYRAAAYQKLGQHAKAVADLSVLLSASPRDSGYYDLRAQSYEALGDKARATADRHQATELARGDPKQLNNRAWHLLTDPPAQRDTQTALKLAQRAVELAPSEALYVNTLGVAQYRNGFYEEALGNLERSLALGNGKWDAFDLFFMAMCHYQLGEPKKAQDSFDRAVRWFAEQQNLPARYVEELSALQSEAEAILRASAAHFKQ
ncbi:MAG TPA: protein kinase [Gemmataceae bacterium]|nr:protein kinase [Gemmataceae bacterium]